MTPNLPIQFAHIPKTGGTTLLYHFRTHLGDDRVFVFGPHGRRLRFFAGQYQLEELTREEQSRIAVLQGHGVGERSLGLVPGGAVRLIVVLRHPVAHARSWFNQMHIGRTGRGVDVTTGYFLAETRPDVMARRMVQQYPGFVDPDAEGMLAQARSVLRCFDDVFLTEGLDAQVGPLMAAMGLPGTLERRRVAEQKVPLLMSDAEIAARSAIDVALFEEAQAGLPAGLEPGARHNPFGFDAGRRDRLGRALAETYAQDAAGVYQDLADALCLDLRAEEALALHGRGGPLPVRDPARFLATLRAAWERHAEGLTPEQLDISRRKAEA